jgi:phosphoglycerate kinase
VIGKFFTDKVSGFVMQAEIDNAQKILEYAERPFTAIMGGSKISDKILIIERLLDKVDNLIIGGGMTYTFSLAEGGKIGKSISEPDKVELAKSLIEKAKAKGVNIYMPLDNICADDFSNQANRQTVERGEIPDGWEGLDIGPKTIELFQDIVSKSKTILWNGPMGVFEMEKFQNGTKSIALAVSAATAKGAFSLVGGGDSVAAVNQFNLADKVSYVSTGGGAMLEYFEGKVLPGIAAIQQ